MSTHGSTTPPQPAVDPRPERQPAHEADIEALGPTEAELRFAIACVITLTRTPERARTAGLGDDRPVVKTAIAAALAPPLT